MNCLLLREDAFPGRTSRCLTCAQFLQLCLLHTQPQSSQFQANISLLKEYISIRNTHPTVKVLFLRRCTAGQKCFVMSLPLLLKCHWIYWRNAFQIKSWNYSYKIAAVFDLTSQYYVNKTVLAAGRTKQSLITL